MYLHYLYIVLFCSSVSLFQAKYNKNGSPNVLYILSDDQGYRDVGYHGSRFPTPVIDQLAADGVKLENYYVQPICTPTRTQLMTGRYQIRTGLQHAVLDPLAPSCLPTDEITIGEKMKEAGYSTHYIGKWHLGFYNEACLPNNRGFDSFLGLLLGRGDHFTHESAPPSLIAFDFRRNLEPAFEYNGTYSTTAFTEEALNIINNKEDDTPFFILLSHQAPRPPLQVPEEYKEPLRHLFEDENRLTYAAMMAALDESTGQLVDALKNKGIYEDTVIIYSSDNGAAIRSSGYNWPLRGQKFTNFEGALRAVGFVHSPLLPKKVQGTINNELIHISDWFPTIVQGIAGGNVKDIERLDGINQWNTIRYGRCSRRFEILHNLDPLIVTPGGREWVRELSPFNISILASLRYRDWKLITGDQGNSGWYAPPDTDLKSIDAPETTEQIVWLYNIKNDPLEMQDLSEKRRGIVKFLLKRLNDYFLESVPVFFPPQQPDNANPCLNGNNCIWGPWLPS